MILIPGRGIVVGEEILAMSSVGVGGKTHVHRYKHADWARRRNSLGSLSDVLTTLNVALAGVPRADGVQRGSRGPEIGLELLGLLQDYQKSGKCSAQ